MTIIEDYDRQRAFSVGFALAARDHGLDETEFKAICKIAAAVTQQPVVPITDAKQRAQVQADDFAKQKARQVTAKGAKPPAPANKLAAAATRALRRGPKGIPLGGGVAPGPAPTIGTPPAPPPFNAPTPPPDVLPPDKSVFDPAYAKQIQAWEDSQKPKTDPRTSSPGAILPGGVNRLSSALRSVLPENW